MVTSGSGQATVNVTNTNKATVEIKAFREDAVIPKKATESAAGYDLCAWLKDSYDEQTLISPHSTMIVPTGLNVNIPNGYEIQIRPRSGLAAKFGVSEVVNRYKIIKKHRLSLKFFYIASSLRFFMSLLKSLLLNKNYFLRSLGNIYGFFLIK